VRLLVTGASGFVGRYLCSTLSSAGHEVISLSRDGDVEHQVDVSLTAAVEAAIADIQPQGIFHLAAIAFVPDAERDAATAESVNVEGTRNVLDAAAKCGAKVLFVSSGAVYGDGSGSSPPFDEESLLSPRGVYASTKIRAEKECLARADRQSIVRVRAFNHTGPGQPAEYVCSGFARQVAAAKLGLAEPVIRVGDLSAERDFCDVRDIVRAYYAAYCTGTAGEVYNVCSGEPRRIRTILDDLVALAGIAVDVEIDGALLRRTEVSRLWGRDDKARSELGWKRQIGWETTLSDMLNWWSNKLAMEASGSAGRGPD
jgi:GDP-4-dehydro-6-deoxy-D-mannose reductase